MNKIKNKSGETLVEVLAAILIITFTFMLLTNSMTSAAEVTKKAKSMNPGFHYSDSPIEKTTVTIKFSDTDITETSTDIELYQSETGEYYYKVPGKGSES